MQPLLRHILSVIVAVAIAIAGMYAIFQYTPLFDKPGKVQVVTALENKAPEIPLGAPLGDVKKPALVIDLGVSDAQRDVRSLPVVGVCPNLTPAGEIVVGVAPEGEKHLGLSCINAAATVAAVEVPEAPMPPEVPPMMPEDQPAPPAPADPAMPPADPMAPEGMPAPDFMPNP